MPAEAAVRMASKECLKACTDVMVQGVGQLPIAPEHRESLTKFLRNSKGQVLVAQMLALLLGSGVVDHLPLLTEEMKDVLRTHLPQELRVSTIAQGIEEVMNLLGARLLDILRGLNLGIEASKPAPSPPPPAALPEPPAKLPKPAARQKARVQR